LTSAFQEKHMASLLIAPTARVVATIALALFAGASECLAEAADPFACDALAATSLASAGGSPTADSAISIPATQIDKAIQALDGLIKDALAKSGVPGLAIAVVHEDKLVYARGFGVRQVGTDQPVDENTVFQLASLSKPLGATVIARLVGQGLIDWNTPVVKYLPDFSLSDPVATRAVTIGDLYSHRSGLPDHAGDLLEDLGYGRSEILQRLRYEPLAPFRATYAYTNFGVTAAAEAVAKASKTSWEALSKQVLYEPLGMASTSSRYADYAGAANKAVLHVKVDGQWEAKYTRQPDAQSPAGGASSSAADMARWLRLQLANGQYEGAQLVAAKALIQTRCPHMVSSPPYTSISRASFYGLGWGISYDSAGRVRFSHSGAFALGAATTVALLPSENLGLVVLTNGMPVGVPEAVAASFLDLVEAGAVKHDWLKLYGERFAQMAENPRRQAEEKPAAAPEPPLGDAAYVGTYANPYYGPARIVAAGGGLVMKLGPKPLDFPLRPITGNRFAYVPVGENATGSSEVSFTLARGKAAKLTIENLDANHLGTFTRQ
jgi:CubicO group peptidase (beta-lactamase class C family)